MYVDNNFKLSEIDTSKVRSKFIYVHEMSVSLPL